ncbi:MAG: glycosyltransferase family 61 protein [Candidatus Babeliaceae bacterium]
MKKLLFVFFFYYIIFCSINIPNPAYLKKIYNITDAQGIKIIAQFPEYKDFISYGERPNCFDPLDLLTLNSTIDWDNPQSYGIKSAKNLYIARIHKAFIAPSYLGTIFDYKQQLLFEIMVNPGEPIFWPVESQIKNFNVLKYEKIATVQGPTFFYHWVIDRLPSVLLLRDYIVNDPEIKLIINHHGAIANYVHEYLDLLGIPKHQRIIAEENTLYYAHKIYFATPFLMEPIPKKLLLKLRNELLQAASKCPISRQYKNNLIVVIQRKESDRKIRNLNELLEVIKTVFADQDYEIIIFDGNMSVSEQIQIFNNARLIIGVMASGLTNILYANPGAFVIEIHPKFPYLNKAGVNNSGNEWCWWLSSVIGLNYWVIPVLFNLSNPSVVCPLDHIKKILDMIIIKKS